MASSFSDTDKGYKARMDAAKKAAAAPYSVTVGIHEEDDELAEGSTDGTTLLEVAEANEFGLGVPQRSFLADWADENAAKNKAMVSKMAKKIIKGEVDTEEALDQLGLLWVASIQKRIKAGIEPPNAESTIARKGSSTPLINTGQLWQSIRHKVEKQ